VSSIQWLDNKYILLLSSRFDRFVRKNNTTFNTRCPYCGDSKKNLRKARGYIYLIKGNYVYHCHNCGISKKVSEMLFDFDRNLYHEYVKEKLLDSRSETRSQVETFTFETPKFAKHASLKGLQKISQLDSNHPAKRYIESRLIPPEFHYQLYYCLAFKKWVNTFISGKFESDDRILFNHLAFLGVNSGSRGSIFTLLKNNRILGNVFGASSLS